MTDVPFQLQINSFYKAVDIMQSGWPTKIISMVSPDEDRILPLGKHHLFMRFDDIDYDDPDLGYIAPTYRDIEEGLNFSANFTKDDTVLIHCTAGKSRSTAMAIGALCQHDMMPYEALAAVCAIRPIVIPNLTVIRMVDDILGLGGGLRETIKAHYNSFPADTNIPCVLLRRHEIDDL